MVADWLGLTRQTVCRLAVKGVIPGFRIAGMWRFTVDDLRKMATVPVDEAEPAFRDPLVRDATTLHGRLAADDRVVLLGSVATDKYVGPLLDVFGERLLFPATFAGRGDMSRGGLLLRCARTGTPLDCVPVRGAVRHGPKPPKLPRLDR